MGLIKAAVGAAGGVMADQWKEFFYCESMPKEVLVTKGVKRTSGRSSNTRGSDNIITSGSGIAVADGQCMMIVEQGRVVELCAEPGEFTYDASSEPSVFSGSLSAGIKNTFAQIGKRFTYGGDTGKDQRVYYFNTKELIDNKFGTPNPIPFRVVDNKIGLDVDAEAPLSPGQQVVFQKEDCSLAVFLAGLEHKVHLTAKLVFQLFQGPGRADQSGGVGVVAAGVGHPRIAGGVGGRFAVLNGQGVGIRAEHDLLPAAALAPQDAQHPGPAHPLGGDADGGQFLLDTLGGFIFPHTQLRMVVKVPSQ